MGRPRYDKINFTSLELERGGGEKGYFCHFFGMKGREVYILVVEKYEWNDIQ